MKLLPLIISVVLTVMFYPPAFHPWFDTIACILMGWIVVAAVFEVYAAKRK